MDNGKNRLADFVNVTLDLSREARIVAYLAMKGKGKIKGKEIARAERIRAALLEECEVDEKTGAVTWHEGEVKFHSDEDFDVFRKAVDRLLDDEGVEFDLTKGADELQAKVEAKADDLKAAKKAVEEAAKATAGKA